MASFCPTCGAPVSTWAQKTVMDRLTQTDRERARDLFMSQNGEWFMTYRNPSDPPGPIPRQIVEALISTKRICRKYSDLVECYTASGRTIDVEQSDRGAIVYTKQPVY